MKQFKSFVLLFVVLATFSSCTFYNPIYTNTPSYEEVGEINLGVNLGTTADVNFSSNPVEHLSIIADASYSGQITNQTGRFANPDAFELYQFDQYQVQAGVGYYYKIMDNVQHDFHVGYGFGDAAETYNSGAIQADFTNLFIQSSIVFALDETAKAVISSKFNRLTFTDFVYAREYEFDDIPEFNDQQRYWLNQFGLGLIIPYGPLEFSAQGQINIPFARDVEEIDRPIGAYVGVTFNINEIFNSSR